MDERDTKVTDSDYFAHYSPEDGRYQLLRDHLEGTASLARQFSEPFGCGVLAEVCGLLHDYGKYSLEFQRRIRGANIRIDHSTPGGQFICDQNKNDKTGYLRQAVAFCVMGHHGKGLPDGGSASDSEGETTLHGRLHRRSPDCTPFLSECKLPNIEPPKIAINDGFSAAFFIRMVFSAMVDADYLDTETFFQKDSVLRGGFDGIPNLYHKLLSYVKQKYLFTENEKEPLNQHRNALLKSCLNAASEDTGLFTLTAPTGSGKTVSSLAFALRHATKMGKRRVIFIVPYNTVIEQNAAVFESILGSENILQHHSNMQYNRNDDDGVALYSEEENRKRYSVENWDYPVIVTSCVQFFESLFAAQPGKCRKLHNISNSVLIFDEAQTIPLPLLLPCTRVIQELVLNYGCTAVLATATQSAIENYFGPLSLREITENLDEEFTFFNRVTIKNILSESFTEKTLASRLFKHDRFLCIVNTRKRAQQLFSELKGIESEGVYHLSTTMTPNHRRQVLNEIRSRLRDPTCPPCRVVSTSLIEAGVDIDFPLVYREIAGLDSIIQAAGRCNREGKQSADSSFLYIFQFEDFKVPLSQQANIDAFSQIARRYHNLNDPGTIHAYFEQLLYNKGTAALDEKSVIKRFNQMGESFDFPFRTVADEFQFIEQNTQEIYVLKDRQELEIRLRSGERSRSLFREMGQYHISLYGNDIKALQSLGQIEKLDDEILLLPEIFYDDSFGVNLFPQGGNALFAD